jgi:uncharacterized protein
MSADRGLLALSLAFLLISLMYLTIRHADAASFDCAGQLTTVERAICANERLSRLDDELEREYKHAVEYGRISHLREKQRQWIRERDACKTENCLVHAYDRRLAELDEGRHSHIEGCTEGASVCNPALY